MKYNAVRKTTHSTDVVKIRKLTKSNISLNRSIEVDLLFVVISLCIWCLQLKLSL